MVRPKGNLVERGLAERYTTKNIKERVRATQKGKNRAFSKGGVIGRTADRFYSELVRMEKRVNRKELWSKERLDSYAKLLSVIFTRLRGELKGKKILEIGPGNATVQLEVLKKLGADIHSIEPERAEKISRVAKNEPSLWDIETAHPGKKFDVVFSRGVFEYYSAVHYPGLRDLFNIDRRRKFWKQLAGRIKPGGLLVLSDLTRAKSRKLLMSSKELEKAGFELLVDSTIELERTGDSGRNPESDHLIVARRKSYG